MNPVIQQEATGCGIASCAAIAGIPYAEAKKVANDIGIYAEDKMLWSDTGYIRKLLDKLGFSASRVEKPFVSWQSLPDCALLAIKWHVQDKRAFWHWVVFVREGGDAYVLDSKQSLKKNVRKDFGRMKPAWYIKV